MLFLMLIGKIEESSLHAKSEQYQKQSGIGVQVGDYAILSAGNQLVSVEGDKQIVEKTPDDRT